MYGYNVYLLEGRPWGKNNKFVKRKVCTVASIRKSSKIEFHARVSASISQELKVNFANIPSAKYVHNVNYFILTKV